MKKSYIIILSTLLLTFTVLADGEVPESTEVLADQITSFEECVAAGNPVMRSYPPKCGVKGQKIFTQKIKKKEVCKNNCGNGTCEEIVCMAVGCPCSESKDSCPEDCS